MKRRIEGRPSLPSGPTTASRLRLRLRAEWAIDISGSSSNSGVICLGTLLSLAQGTTVWLTACRADCTWSAPDAMWQIRQRVAIDERSSDGGLELQGHG